MFALVAGLTAGLLHVFSGPDHLAAVAPLTSDDDRGQWRVGLQWGVGHTAGVLLIALLLLLFREQLPLDAISAYSERIVGGMLIALGAWGIRGAWLQRKGHAHSHDDRHTGRHYTGASFVMGAVHGLAGSSHLFGVLPALAMPGREAPILYLAGFGVGAIVGMTAFATVMGLLAHRLGRRGPGGLRGLVYASSAAALVVGGVWLVGQ